MGLEEIGLLAVMQNADFLGGMKEYIKSVQSGKDETRTAGQAMTENLSMIGGTIVTGAIALAVGAIASVASACIASIPAVMDWAETIDGIGDVLGTNADESAALDVAIEGVGGNVEAITGQMAFLTKGLKRADGYMGPTGLALYKMGIKFKDAKGEMLPASEILTNVADVVGKMPDGLEKTKIMTELFGKSGKDLSDVMSALADGGLAAADEKARALGLSLGDDLAGNAIDVGREFKTIQLMGKGLMVTLGKDLLPIITPLIKRFSELAMKAMPVLRDIIGKVAEKVGEFVNIVVANIPKVIEWFKQVIDFLNNNQFIVIGVLGAMGVAVATFVYTTVIPAAIAAITAMAPLMLTFLAVAAVIAGLAWAWQNNFLGMRDIITQFWTNTVQPALQALWAWLQINIPIALAYLANLWQTVLLPAIQAVWAWMESSLFPTLQTVWNWLATNIPLAIQTFLTWWNGVLLPALQVVWTWIQTYLVPLFLAIANLFSVIMTLAVQTFLGFWNGQLLPAFQAVWEFIQSSVVPVFKELWSWLAEKLKPVIVWASNFLGYTFVNSLKSLESMIRSVIQWIERLAEKLASLVVPDVMQPGSPTPFEIGLRGVGDAVREVTSALAPMQVNLDRAGRAAAGGQSSSPTPAANVTNVSNVFNMGGQAINNGWDAAQLRSFILDTVRSAI
jgi:TP901 family phage tail tape measure protein